jgi:hypothetical protein
MRCSDSPALIGASAARGYSKRADDGVGEMVPDDLASA